MSRTNLPSNDEFKKDYRWTAMTQQEQPPYRPHDCGGCREIGVSQMIDGQWAHRWKNGNITTCLAATPSPSSELDVERITLLRGTLALIAEGREPAQEMADAALMRDDARLQQEQER